MKLFEKVFKTPQPLQSPTDLTHVTEEMYKKNFELAEKNKTLSLLRKIDEIILSTVTDTDEIAQQVTDLVTNEAEFKTVVILLYNKKENDLTRLAISQTDEIKKVRDQHPHGFVWEKLSLSNATNIIAKSIRDRQMNMTHNWFDIFGGQFSEEEAKNIQAALGIGSTFIYPLVVRDEVIGAMLISVGEAGESLSVYKRDLMERLVNVIGIAIDNALLYQKIEEKNEQLRQLDRLKDEFVSLASHELRTPMTVIKSYLWMTLAGKGGELTDKQKFYLSRALTSTDRLITFVNEMLNVSRIESNRITIQTKPTDLQSFVSDLLLELEPRAQELKVGIHMTPADNLPKVQADPDKIREVFTNLIGNSMKFTPAGGSITISFSAKDGFVQIDIKDTGVGMTQEDLPKLFHKFGMVGDNYLIKTNSQGTGLGLYISKAIVELHGGKIWANSEGKEKGSTFGFTLKIADVSGEEVKK